jgi:acetolactate synthase regulatory subunit
MTTNLLTDILESKNIKYNVDTNPSPEKVTRIQRAIERKKGFMDLAVNFYKQARG